MDMQIKEVLQNRISKSPEYTLGSSNLRRCGPILEFKIFDRILITVHLHSIATGYHDAYKVMTLLLMK